MRFREAWKEIKKEAMKKPLTEGSTRHVEKGTIKLGCGQEIKPTGSPPAPKPSEAMEKKAGSELYELRLTSEELQRLKSMVNSSNVRHEVEVHGDWPEEKLDKKILELIISADYDRFQDERKGSKKG